MARDITQLYCERTTSGFWAEPVNAISNLAFFIAAFYATRLLLRHKIKDMWLWFFTGNIAVMGVGSFLFHTGPALPTFLADVIPIAIFIISIFYYILRKAFNCTLLQTCTFIILLITAMLIFRFSSPWDFRIAVSFLFAPVVIALGILSTIFAKYKIQTPLTRSLSRIFGLAAVLFAIAVIVRALDTPLCALLPHGLHFVWHIINASVCYLVFLACFEIRQHNTLR